MSINKQSEKKEGVRVNEPKPSKEPTGKALKVFESTPIAYDDDADDFDFDNSRHDRMRFFAELD
jgi:hypothetical protein